MFGLARRHLTATLILFGFVLSIAGLCWLVLLSGLPAIGMPPQSAPLGHQLAADLAATLGRTRAIWACVGMLAAGMLLTAAALLRALSAAIERWV